MGCGERAVLTNVFRSPDCPDLSENTLWLVVVNASAVISEKHGRCCIPRVITRGCTTRFGDNSAPCTGAIAIAVLVSSMWHKQEKR